jgi:hypothetical protein
MPTLFEHAGGEEALHRLEQVFYDSVLADPLLRPREHVEFGSKVAMQNSHAESDDELHPLREVPRWTWAGDEKQA